jgi:hypothetical protein
MSELESDPECEGAGIFVSESREFIVGSEVTCTDGDCGELRRLILDPVARSLEHLVVEPSHRQQAGRLVPVGLVTSAGKTVRLSCTLSEFSALDEAQVTETSPNISVDWGYVQQQMGTPYGGGGPIYDLYTPPVGPRTTTHDIVPADEEEVRGGDGVHATNGSIGHVWGLVTGAGDHRVTHILLDEGHLLAHRRVAIPISAVRAVDAGIRLSLTKDEVRGLQSLNLDLPE